MGFIYSLGIANKVQEWMESFDNFLYPFLLWHDCLFAKEEGLSLPALKKQINI